MILPNGNEGEFFHTSGHFFHPMKKIICHNTLWKKLCQVFVDYSVCNLINGASWYHSYTPIDGLKIVNCWASVILTLGLWVLFIHCYLFTINNLKIVVFFIFGMICLRKILGLSAWNFPICVYSSYWRCWCSFIEFGKARRLNTVGINLS